MLWCLWRHVSWQKYIWRDTEKVDQLPQGMLYLPLRYNLSLLFVCSMNDIPPSLFLSREDDDDVRDIGKHDFCSVLPHPIYGIKCSMLFNGNQSFPRNSCRWVHHNDYSSMPQASNKPRFHLNPLFRNPFNLKPPPFSQELFCLFITNCRLLLCNLSVKER